MPTHFQSGHFDRAKVSKLLRPLCPMRAVESILDIDPAELAARGKSVLLLDLDNTLLVWRGEEIPSTTADWLARAKAAGLRLFLLSNTRHPDRLNRLAAKLEIPVVTGKFKPSTSMFLGALAKAQATPDQAVMIGDQIFTDILGANRTGIESIWVKQMAPRDFIGTKISRMGERIVRRKLYRTIAAEKTWTDPHLMGGAEAIALLEHPVVRQFVKFVLVGGLSTVIDIGIYWTLVWVVPGQSDLLSRELGQQLIAWQPGFFESVSRRPDGIIEPALAFGIPAKIFSTIIAIFNSFVWNRKWTFQIQGKEEKFQQLKKFYAVALIGLAMNSLIVALTSNILPGHVKRSNAVGLIIATVVVSFWNFFGQKFFTFRSKEA